MHATTPTNARCRFRRYLRKHSFLLHLGVCFFSVASATVFVGLAPEAEFIWVANGVLLSYLLLAPRKRWPAYVCTAYLAQFAAGLLAGHHGIASGLYLTLLNVAESLVSAVLLRRRSADLPDFTNPAYITRFLAFGVLAGPVIMGVVNSLLSPLWHTGSPLWHVSSPGVEFLQWVAADSLGACVATPACVAIFRTRFRNSLYSFKNWALLLPVVACAVAAFCQAQMPLPFLLYPLLVLVLLRLGLGWASLATLFVSAVASSFTVRGQGPFAPPGTMTSLKSAMLVQLFIAGAMFILYSVSVVLESLRSTERRLMEIAALHNLVMENSRDVIVIADFDGNLNFVSAAGANWGGWNRAELQQLPRHKMVHPEDRSILVAAVHKLRAGKEGALVECRVRARNGTYVWVEASLRTIHDPITQLPTGILLNVREITTRKLAEQQLAEAYHAVEALASTDALTGLANRRRFDECLTTEWRRALRDHKPISLLLVDVDYFKSYNDTYGHLRGDSCLKQIASVVQGVLLRPGDLVARFGGEEFAVVLPNTPDRGAMQIAQEICAAMTGRKQPHAWERGATVCHEMRRRVWPGCLRRKS